MATDVAVSSADTSERESMTYIIGDGSDRLEATVEADSANSMHLIGNAWEEVFGADHRVVGRIEQKLCSYVSTYVL